MKEPIQTLASTAHIELLFWFNERQAEKHWMQNSDGGCSIVEELLETKAIEQNPRMSGMYRRTPLGDAWLAALCKVRKPYLAYVDEFQRR